jgi:hypothetical protein
MKAARAVLTYLYRRIDNIPVAHARFAQAKHELGGRTGESISEQREPWRVFFYEFDLQSPSSEMRYVGETSLQRRQVEGAWTDEAGGAGHATKGHPVGRVSTTQ